MQKQMNTTSYKRTKNLESWILWYIFLSPRGEHYLTRGDSNNNPIKIKYPEVCWVGSSLYLETCYNFAVSEWYST